MSNNWYQRVKGFLAGTKARGSDVRFEYDAIEDAFDDMPAPHSSVPTTKGFADAIELESTLQVDGTTNLAGGLGANVSGADTYKLTDMIDGSDTQDYATIANVNAIAAGGGSPGDIPITSLDVGTATANQSIRINSAGTAPEGFTPNPKGRNFLINGCMRVNQQGNAISDVPFTSATTPANSDDTYLLDGWYLLSDGNDIFDVSQELTTANLPDGAFAATKLDVETISKKGGILQIIEAQEVSRLFEGGNGNCSLSFKAKRTGSAMEIKAAVLAWDSTADTVTSDVVSAWNVDGTTPTFATNWTAENTPADLGLSTSYQTFKIENISLDTASTTNLAVFIWVDTTTTNAGEFVYITDVQLERGVEAEDYHYEPYVDVLSRCYRYQYVLWYEGADTSFGSGVAISTTTARIYWEYPIRLRTTPTFSVSNLAHFAFFTTAARTTTNILGNQIRETGVLLNLVSSGATAGHGAYAYIDDSGGWMKVQAIL